MQPYGPHCCCACLSANKCCILFSTKGQPQAEHPVFSFCSCKRSPAHTIKKFADRDSCKCCLIDGVQSVLGEPGLRCSFVGFSLFPKIQVQIWCKSLLYSRDVGPANCRLRNAHLHHTLTLDPVSSVCSPRNSPCANFPQPGCSTSLNRVHGECRFFA